MGFTVSPGINITEKDLTTIVPAVATTRAGTAGRFAWGPTNEITTVDSENMLTRIFGKPDTNTYRYFMTAASFLAYGNNLQVVRTTNGGRNARSSAGDSADLLVGNRSEFDVDSNVSGYDFIGKYPGDLGNSLRVAVCDSPTAFETILTDPFETDSTTSKTYSAGASNLFVKAGSISKFAVGDRIRFLDGDANDALVQTTVYKVTAVTSVATDSAALDDDAATTDSTTTDNYITISQLNDVVGLKSSLVIDSGGINCHRRWEYADQFNESPGGDFGTNQGTTFYTADRSGSGDAMHVVVVDEDGEWSGIPGTILERYSSVSKASDAKKQDGSGNYFKNVINDASLYIWVGRAALADADNGNTVTAVNPTTTSWGNAALSTTFGQSVVPVAVSLQDGNDGSALNASSLTGLGKGFNLFDDPDLVDVNLILAGPAGEESTTYDSTSLTTVQTVHQYLIDNIAEDRKDLVVFLSPPASCTVGVTDQSKQDANIREYVTATSVSGASNDFATYGLNRSTSYAVMDTGQKYMYDLYNDVFRYVPLNGDIAGLTVRTDEVADPWFSPAGFNRGQLKNVTKLPFNPRQSFRDNLYQRGVNSVVAFAGQGTVLYGDKTLLAKPSAFDRINVRRLFLILEKSISTAAKFSLFEFNDEFTRSQFVALVEPFLRNVQGRRGITDFKVVCDTTNNTGDVIDRNEFVADIYIKPARSINYIKLNFINTPTGLSFEEIGG